MKDFQKRKATRNLVVSVSISEPHVLLLAGSFGTVNALEMLHRKFNHSVKIFSSDEPQNVQ